MGDRWSELRPRLAVVVLSPVFCLALLEANRDLVLLDGPRHVFFPMLIGLILIALEFWAMRLIFPHLSQGSFVIRLSFAVTFVVAILMMGLGGLIAYVAVNAYGKGANFW